MHLDTYDDETIIIHVDFSANYKCKPNYQETCGAGEDAIQLVFIVSHSPKVVQHSKGYMHRIQENESHCFWGEKAKGEIDTNYHFYNACLERVIQHYKDRFAQAGKQLRNVFVLTDGCAAQFKSRKNAWHIKNMAELFDLDNFIHTYAPTSCFKCCCDNEGGCNKRCLDWLELTCQIRANTAFLCFKALVEKQPKLSRLHDDQRKLMTITSRTHYFVIDAKWREHALYAGVENIVFTNFEAEEVNATKVVGIKSLYQLRSDKSGTLYRRDTACWCSSCIKGDFETCLGLEHGIETWQEDRIQARPIEKKRAGKHNESKGTNRGFYYRMYKDRLEPEADRPVLVALKREDQGVLFAHVVSKAFKAKREGERTIQHFGKYKWAADEACFEIIPLKSLVGNTQRFAYISQDAVSHTLPLRLTVLPHMSQGSIQLEDWVKGTWDASYIKITTSVQEHFRELIKDEAVDVDRDA
jgi:hypothetical protein